MNKNLGSCDVFFRQNFNEMFIFVSEQTASQYINRLWMAWFHWHQHYVTRWHNKFTTTSMINIHLQSCIPKITKICAHLYKLLWKTEWHLFIWTWCIVIYICRIKFWETYSRLLLSAQLIMTFLLSLMAEILTHTYL